MVELCWPDWLDDVWAKSVVKGEGGYGESLAQHTWYVLQRLTELIHLRSDLPQTLNVPRLWHILFWAAFLHDFGKTAQGFQSVLRGGSRWPYRHEVLSLAFLDWVSAGLSQEEQAWLAAAVVSHHKDATEIGRLYAEPYDEFDDDPLVAHIAELNEQDIRGLWRWLVECPANWIKKLDLNKAGIQVPALPDQDRAVQKVKKEGVSRIWHWLDVYRRFVRDIKDDNNVELVTGTIALRGYLINADHSGSAHAGPLPRAVFDAEAVLTSRNILADKLYEHQKEAGQADGSVLLTAPTGSGKTEAALLWAARQAKEQGGLPRLFYTLPYQASMNAMRTRLIETFGGEMVGLQHGRVLLALYRMLLEADYTPREASQRARWSRNLVKLNYPPVRVFSPYQMLKGMYQLKGYETWLADYHGAAFIFDEIHAYEVKRLAMILKTVEYVRKNYNARFFIMSATFPTLVKEWLQDVLGESIEIVAQADLFARFTRHRLVLLDGELLSEEGLKRIVKDAQAGKSVLVVCNLVDRAQSVYQQLDEMLEQNNVPVTLIHGRFNMRDRMAKEKIVREASGSKSLKKRPIVLVATQVVEVSLDIDLDTIYTDPAPLEALVQRFGRINRKISKGIVPVHVYRYPDDGQKIYNPELVCRTLAILEREKDKPIPESAVGGWLDEIYSGTIAEQWKQEYQAVADEFEATCIRTLSPFSADKFLEELFYKAFDGLQVLPKSLYDEYQQIKKEEPIAANELLVSISWGRYFALANKGRMLPGERGEPYIAIAPYSSEIGLTFD